jgi:predicted amidohydrolase YtcJ
MVWIVYLLICVRCSCDPGALRTGGAALYEPYTDDPTTRGVLRIPQEELEDIIPRFLRDGWQVVCDVDHRFPLTY